MYIHDTSTIQLHLVSLFRDAEEVNWNKSDLMLTT